MLLEIVSVWTWGVFRHRGIKVRVPGHAPVVYANAPGIGVVRQTIAEFSCGRSLHSAPALTTLHPEQVVVRAEQMRGRPYDLLTWNCEHFVECALGNKAESQQLRVVACALIAASLVTRMAS